MSVIGLDGKEIEGAPRKKNAASALRQLLAEIEAGEISVEQFYLVAVGDRHLNHVGNVTEHFTTSYHSGLTIQEGLTILEMEKFRICCMAHGIKAPS